MDGGKNFRVPAGCSFRVHQRTPDTIDIAMTQPWKSHVQAVDIEIHYVIRAGVSGLHTYAVVRHPASYPATKFGEWRMVWKLPSDLLDTICVDRLRFRKMPTAAEFAQAKRTDIGEIVQLTTGPWAGKFDCKYDYNADYHSTPFWGHADSRSGLGAWMVFGSHEWFNDGPTKQDLTSADRIIHVHFGMNHYHSEPTAIAAGEEWSKTYGPFLLYLNHVDGGPAAAVQDAAGKTREETAAWPYRLDAAIRRLPARRRPRKSHRPLHPHRLRQTRTHLRQRLDRTLPATSPAETGSLSRRTINTGPASAPTAASPSPTSAPAPTRSAPSPTAHTANSKKPASRSRPEPPPIYQNITWTIPRTRGKLVWEIGTPNRRADEFRHGDDYFQGYLWKNFGKEFSNPLEYHIGRSVPAKDWNYAHSSYPTNDGKVEPWKWRIHFELDQAPSADATLTIGFASADRARLQLFLNDEPKPFHTLDPKIQGGNALLREGIHAKYSFDQITVPAKSLRKGKNTLTLVQSRTYSPSFHVMYDALSLEVP